MTESPSDSPCVTLLAAAEWGLWVEVERALADVAAPIDDRDAEGHSALHWAASHGHAPTVEALLARGADPNSPGDDGWTAVMWAAHSGSLPCLTALVGAGGDVNVEVEGGEGALAQVVHFAHGDAEGCLALLLSLPALDLGKGWLDGVPPQQLAREAGRESMAAAIEQELVWRRRWSPLRIAWVAAVVRAADPWTLCNSRDCH